MKLQTWRKFFSITTLFTSKSFTAPCFGSCIRSHHQGDKVLKKPVM